MSKSSDLEYACKANLTVWGAWRVPGAKRVSSAPRDGVTTVQSEPGGGAQASTPNSRGTLQEEPGQR